MDGVPPITTSQYTERNVINISQPHINAAPHHQETISPLSPSTTAFHLTLGAFSTGVPIHQPPTTAPTSFLQSHGSSLPPIPSILNPFSSAPTVNPFSSTLNQTCAVKLDRSNYLLWKSIVTPVVRGHRLDEFLLGTKVPPPRTIVSPMHVIVPNPAYETRIATDQLLMGWLLSSMTEQALVEVVGCSSSSEVWGVLETLFNSRYESHMLEYKEALTKTDKGSRSMVDYLALMKTYSDGLTAAGYPISNAELILATLGGLGKDYESVIVNITSRIGSLSWQEV